MSKIIFWLVVVFAILLGLRLLNTAKARKRALLPPVSATGSPPARDAGTRVASRTHAASRRRVREWFRELIPATFRGWASVERPRRASVA